MDDSEFLQSFVEDVGEEGCDRRKTMERGSKGNSRGNTERRKTKKMEQEGTEIKNI